MLNRICCVILAGGVEHRFENSVPRILQPLCGVPVVGHLVKTVESLGINHITVVSNVREIKNHLGSKAAFLYQTQNKGSGDALYRAKDRIEEFDGDVLVVYGDRPLLKASTIEKLVTEGRKENAGCAFLSVVLNKPHGHARIMRNTEGAVVQTGRDCEIAPQDGKIREVIAGAYYFPKKVLLKAFAELKPAELSQFYMTDITTWTARKKEAVIVPVPDPQEVQGIYSLKELAAAETLVQSTLLERWTMEGVQIVDPRTTWISADAQIGSGTILYPHTVIEGPCRIGRDCHVGPFAHIRADVVLGNQVKIGNFVEIVRSRIGDRTRILHLSFIGDAEIAPDVKIGAGTITANSDGTFKHKTIIEEQATIGSGTILIAPVKIGQGAATGAGAVIPKNQDVAEGETVVGVPARTIGKVETAV